MAAAATPRAGAGAAETGEGALPPFPEGWFYIAARRELRGGRLVARKWMGIDIVVWRDAEGRIGAARSVCPHLGADLSPDAGGRVTDGLLVCPFHHFCFDASGQCVATPSGSPARSARLSVIETQEVSGLIFGWWGIGGRPPQWRLPPVDALADRGAPESAPSGPDRPSDLWSSQEFRTIRFPGHPQETTENSVDIAHLSSVHGYSNVTHPAPAAIDGPRLTNSFGFTVSRKFAKLAKVDFEVSATALVVGLGYSLVEIREHCIGMDARMWILATPIDGTLIDFTLVSAIRPLRRPRRRIAGLAFLPVGVRTSLMNKFVLYMQMVFVKQDVVIWSRKNYLPRPRLARGDADMAKYREYCKQFYPQSAEPR